MNCKIAIDGANTLLGQAIIDVINERKLITEPVVALLPGAADKPETEDGDQFPASARVKIVECFIDDFDYSTVNIIFIAGNKQSAEDIITPALGANAMVIDLSGYAAEQEQFPLIVSGLNDHEIQNLVPGFVVATPSPATTMLAQVICPIAQHAILERVNVTHLSPVSSQGKSGVDELAGQTARLLSGMPIEKKVFPTQIAFNVLPQNGAIDDMGRTEQERMLIVETKRLLNDDSVAISATCIQVPVFYAQSQVIDLVFAHAVEYQRIETVLRQTGGLTLVKNRDNSPAVLKSGDGDDPLIVGRIRRQGDDEQALSMWCVADNLRRAAAVNAVQIAEILIKSYL